MSDISLDITSLPALARDNSILSDGGLIYKASVTYFCFVLKMYKFIVIFMTIAVLTNHGKPEKILNLKKA